MNRYYVIVEGAAKIYRDHYKIMPGDYEKIPVEFAAEENGRYSYVSYL